MKMHILHLVPLDDGLENFQLPSDDACWPFKSHCSSFGHGVVCQFTENSQLLQGHIPRQHDFVYGGLAALGQIERRPPAPSCAWQRCYQDWAM
jgi:hypothetical protein